MDLTTIQEQHPENNVEFVDHLPGSVLAITERLSAWNYFLIGVMRAFVNDRGNENEIDAKHWRKIEWGRDGHRSKIIRRAPRCHRIFSSI